MQITTDDNRTIILNVSEYMGKVYSTKNLSIVPLSDYITKIDAPNKCIFSFTAENIEKYLADKKREKNNENKQGDGDNSDNNEGEEEDSNSKDDDDDDKKDKSKKPNTLKKEFLKSTQDEFMFKFKKQKRMVQSQQVNSLMKYKFIGYGTTKYGYEVYLYYIGPTVSKDDEKSQEHLVHKKNWQLVPLLHLTYFHKNFKWQDCINHGSTDNEYRALRFSQNGKRFLYPEYDPRFIVWKWSNTTDEGRRYKTLVSSTVCKIIKRIEKKRKRLKHVTATDADAAAVVDANATTTTNKVKKKKEKNRKRGRPRKKRKTSGGGGDGDKSKSKSDNDITKSKTNISSNIKDDNDDDTSLRIIKDVSLNQDQLKEIFNEDEQDDNGNITISRTDYESGFSVIPYDDFTTNINDIKLLIKQSTIKKRVKHKNKFYNWEPIKIINMLVKVGRNRQDNIDGTSRRHIHEIAKIYNLSVKKDDAIEFENKLLSNPDIIESYKESFMELITSYIGVELLTRQPNEDIMMKIEASINQQHSSVH